MITRNRMMMLTSYFLLYFSVQGTPPLLLTFYLFPLITSSIVEVLLCLYKESDIEVERNTRIGIICQSTGIMLNNLYYRANYLSTGFPFMLVVIAIYGYRLYSSIKTEMDFFSNDLAKLNEYKKQS